MKFSINPPDAAPTIVLSDSDVRKLRSAWHVLEELAFRGRNGAFVGGHPYPGQTLEALAQHVRALTSILPPSTATTATPAQPIQQAVEAEAQRMQPAEAVAEPPAGGWPTETAVAENGDPIQP